MNCLLILFILCLILIFIGIIFVFFYLKNRKKSFLFASLYFIIFGVISSLIYGYPLISNKIEKEKYNNYLKENVPTINNIKIEKIEYLSDILCYNQLSNNFKTNELLIKKNSYFYFTIDSNYNLSFNSKINNEYVFYNNNLFYKIINENEHALYSLKLNEDNSFNYKGIIDERKINSLCSFTYLYENLKNIKIDMIFDEINNYDHLLFLIDDFDFNDNKLSFSYTIKSYFESHGEYLPLLTLKEDKYVC